MGNEYFRRLKSCFAVLMAAVSFASFAYSDKYTSGAEIFFGFGSVNLNAGAKAKLESMVTDGNVRYPDVFIAVGHATKGERQPQALSERRAMAVKFYLMQLGVPPTRIYLEGKGVSQFLNARQTSRSQRAEVEFVGTYSVTDSVAGNSLMVVWDAGSDPRSKDLQRDQWSDTTPLQFLPQVTDKRLRNRFLRKLQLVAIRNKDDGFLKTLWSLNGAGSIPADEYVSPALYANVFGTPYARQLLSGELARLPADDPTRLRFGQRLWCDGLRFGSLATVMPSVLPALTSIASTPPHEQFGWLYCAADRANEADISWLIQLGVSVNVTDSNGRTALHRAVLNHKLSGMPALIAAGANPNLRDKDGSTPLHLVAQSQFAPMFPLLPSMRRRLWDILIQAGADPSIADHAGRLPVVPDATSLR
jgi:OmpA family/Ankyrin repeats (many copies)